MVSTLRTAALAGAMACWLLGAPSANAAFDAFLVIGAPSSIATYDFSGVLTNGNDAVTGTFTLDNSGTGTITAFNFKDAAGHFLFDAANSSALVATLSATSPNATFVGLTFTDIGGDGFGLLFETTLPSFDGGMFFTGPITGPSFVAQSGVNCSLFSVGPCNTSRSIRSPLLPRSVW
jgi:hypothetical protein